jgi:hypothetical protein
MHGMMVLAAAAVSSLAIAAYSVNTRSKIALGIAFGVCEYMCVYVCVCVCVCACACACACACVCARARARVLVKVRTRVNARVEKHVCSYVNVFAYRHDVTVVHKPNPIEHQQLDRVLKERPHGRHKRHLKGI